MLGSKSLGCLKVERGGKPFTPPTYRYLDHIDPIDHTDHTNYTDHLDHLQYIAYLPLGDAVLDRYLYSTEPFQETRAR